MRRFSAVLVALLAAAVIAGLAPPALAAPVTYVAPVAGTVTDGFRPPKTVYGSGNRGLTYRTANHGVVRAAAPGRVTFAGQVGGTLHVVVQHADGVRTSYSFLRAVATRVGAQVHQGDQIGTSAETFHFGARIADAYIDPAVLLAAGPARVHLVPDGEFRESGADDDRFALISIAADYVGSVASEALDWARDTTGEVSREALLHLITVLDQIVNLGEMVGPFAAMSAALADILQTFVEPCTPQATAKPKVADKRVVVFIAGLTSHSTGPEDPTNLSRRLRREELYGDAAVYDFSYTGGQRPCVAGDTTGDLRDRAADLRDLLDQIARDHPGTAVDLIAHSQGGLIAREALAHDYDGPDHRLPVIAHVVTLATPHHGSDVATLGEALRATSSGRSALGVAGASKGVDLNDKGVQQLSENSEFIYELNRRALREGVSYTSIGATLDWVAPAVRTRLAGAANVLVDVNSLPASHSGITESEAAHREVALALSDLPPTCQNLAITSGQAFTSAFITGFEDVAPYFVTTNPIR